MTYLIHIDDMTFSPDGSTGFIFTNLQGWLGSPPMRTSPDVYPNSDGAPLPDKNNRAPRVITFDGALAGVSEQDAAENFFDRFAALQSSGVPIIFSVERDWGTRSCTVSLMDSAEVTDLGDGVVAAVTAQFIAYDPVKYGPAAILSTGLASGGGGLEYPLGSPSGALYYGANGDLGRVTLSNEGTAPVWPSVTVTGALTTGFYVQRLDTGQTVRYDRVVPAGSTVSVDFRTGEVLVDGLSDGSTYLTRYEFWSVGPGESFEVQFNAIGGSSGTPTAEWTDRDGYW